MLRLNRLLESLEDSDLRDEIRREVERLLDIGPSPSGASEDAHITACTGDLQLTLDLGLLDMNGSGKRCTIEKVDKGRGQLRVEAPRNRPIQGSGGREFLSSTLFTSICLCRPGEKILLLNTGTYWLLSEWEKGGERP